MSHSAVLVWDEHIFNIWGHVDVLGFFVGVLVGVRDSEVENIVGMYWFGVFIWVALVSFIVL